MQNTLEHLICRTALASDEPLLRELFAADRAQEFDSLWLSAEQTAVLLDMQFLARQVSYEREFPDATNTVMCLQDGTSVGYYRLNRNGGDYRLVDWAVLPQFRNQGVGGWTLRKMQQRCAAEHVSLTLRVRRGSPALRLYQRFGFTCVGSDPLSFEMTWAAPLANACACHRSSFDASQMVYVLLSPAAPLAAAPGYNVPEVLFAH